MASRNWKHSLSRYLVTLAAFMGHYVNTGYTTEIVYITLVLLFCSIIHENVQRAKCLDVHKLFTPRLASSIFKKVNPAEPKIWLIFGLAGFCREFQFSARFRLTV